MWQQYKKHLIVTQIFIIAACAFFQYKFQDFPVTCILFVIMQLGSFAGAWFGARIKSKVEETSKKLPLENRRQ